MVENNSLRDEKLRNWSNSQPLSIPKDSCKEDRDYYECCMNRWANSRPGIDGGGFEKLNTIKLK